MGLFESANKQTGLEGDLKDPYLKYLHISLNDATWHSCILPKEDPKRTQIT